MKTKACGTCKKELLLNAENFAAFKRSKDGFANICKSCKKEYDKAYRARNLEKRKRQKREYSQKHQEKISARQKIWRENNKEHIEKYRERNKEKKSAYNKKYWAENKEILKEAISTWRAKNREYIKKYRVANHERDRNRSREWYNSEKGRSLSVTKTNRYRAKKKALLNDFTVEQWIECLNYFDNVCAYCGGSEGTLEQEHFVPVQKKGPLTKSNILPACRSCNASKNDNDFFSWYPKQKDYSEERKIKILNYLRIGSEDNGGSLQIHGQRNQ